MHKIYGIGLLVLLLAATGCEPARTPAQKDEQGSGITIWDDTTASVPVRCYKVKVIGYVHGYSISCVVLPKPETR